ncbi:MULTISPECIES: GreA/GreB family elongation factor [Flavobacterium]|jgi:regulator of nucleoside diphosphate kinase|uniref:GreA/GreB family elongation factor n=1 Tax=Flavobacterium supellecticarium TaxID=2565924 RepID=A0A4S4A2M9_9FLAO|nr:MULTISPECIES: GreA/GreB family elongation factor [Flavobacterium]THF52649.1 GreA/GreB family elongation factor [Flavobacterium supellecticarium]HRB72494.1 GreA/GreB family elongation factor [Flavobacterium sp.]
MKPIPVLTLTDYQLLRELTKSSQNSTSKKEIMQLSQELDRAIVNKNDVLEDNIVRINSFVEIEDTKAKQRMKIQIVLPQLSNIKEGKVSVIAPLSIALIGFKENDEVDWEMPAGVKSLRIISVSNPIEE